MFTVKRLWALLVLCACSLWLGSALATISPTSLTSFGNQNVGTTSAAKTITLSNAVGLSAVTGVTISASGDFSQTNNCPASLAVGASCTINVTFTPTATGSRSGTLTMDGTNSLIFSHPWHSVALSGTGVGVPAASLSQSSLTFGSQAVSTTSSAQVVTLSNGGTGALSISGIAATGDFAQTNNCGSSLSAGSSCNINVTFTPTTSGSRTGSLSVTSNASGSPHSTSLSGTGAAASAPAVTLSASTLTFSSQAVGSTSSTQTVTVTNSGSATLTISGVTASGDYSITSNTCSSVAASGTCSFGVRFAPTVAGTRTGSVSISNNATGSPHTVSLTGTGTAPAVSLSASTLTFSSQTVATTSTSQTITVTNSGSASLTISGVTAAGDFAIVSNTCSTVAAAATCSFGVTFTPTVAGARTGSVSIASNASGSPHSVSLSGTGTASASAAVTLAPTSLTFTSQALTTTSPAQTVTLTNSGGATLNISGISAAGDFAQTSTCGSTLAAAASCTISVTFAPTATGARSGSLSISSNASGSPHAVSLSGTGISASLPAVNLSTTTLSFSSQTVATTSSVQAVTLTNSGGVALSITGITASGDFAQTNTCGSTLNAGASCPINVTFTPTTTGTRTGTLSIASNASGSPHAVSLTGTGATASSPVLQFSASTLIFTNQSAGTTSSAQQVTLTNAGPGSITFSNVASSGEFGYTTTCGASLAANASCQISVTFSPTSTGTKTGSIVITSNASGSPTTISLSGNPSGVSAVVSPKSVDFGNQEVGGSSSAQPISVTNSGSGNLVVSDISVTGDFTQTNTCGNALSPSVVCTISVIFAPTATGTRSGQLTITSNAPDSPQVINLTGNAVGAVVAPPNSVNFTSVTSATQVFATTDPVIGISSNGVVLISDAPAATLVVSGGVDSALIRIPAGKNITFSVNGTDLTYGAVQADAFLQLQTINDQGVAKKVLLLVAGQVDVMVNGATLLGGLGLSDGATPQFWSISLDKNFSTLSLRVDSSTSGVIAMGGGTGRIRSGKIFNGLSDGVQFYSGEAVDLVDSSLKRLRLGSLTGAAGITGDSSTSGNPAANWLYAAKIPALGIYDRNGGTQRLDLQFQESLNAFAGKSFSSSGQDSLGVWRVEAGSVVVNALPIGDVLLNLGKPDGIEPVGDGMYRLTSKGVSATFTPTVTDMNHLVRQTATLDAGATVVMLYNGSLLATLAGSTYVLQPSWLVSKASGGFPGFSTTADGYVQYQDTQRNVQVLYPAFADLATLTTAFRALDANLQINNNGNGTVTAIFNGTTYTLSPDYGLIATPQSAQGKTWWLEGSKVYIVYSDGNSQGFHIR